MHLDKVIRGGTLVTADDTYKADIGIAGERIAAIGLALESPETIDASGKLVMPGGLDVHTHLDMPFGGTVTADDWVSGTTAAACGGTTTLIDFAIQDFGRSLHDGVDAWRKRSEDKAAIDYSFHTIVRELEPSHLEEMDALVKEGITSFKLFMAYPGVFMVDDATIFEAMLRTRENGGLICMHAENGGVIDTLVKRALAEGHTEPKWHALTRPMSAEAEATRRAIALAEMAGVPVYIVHLSAGDAMEEVRRARERGLPVFAETCPQYLFLSYEDYERPGFEGAKYVMSPPLRPRGNEERLWNGLRTDALQAVSTDHCSFCMKEQKELGRNDFSKIPNGAPGIENRMMLLYDGGVNGGRISANRFVELVSTRPAKIFGLYPRKGSITVGADADLLLWDPKRKWTISASTHRMKVDYNAYEGREVTGLPDTVLLRGQVIVRDQKYVGNVKQGRFVAREPGTARTVEG
ncbi:MAG TPA: dihydropyrimidinase [Vicinamibacteria bacterium]|nr:dihydropyrimidinase [Vicinamibacteria bacterium]